MGDRSEAPATISKGEIRQIPGAFGDPFRAIEALPGVTPIVSGLPYFYVRGAPPGNVGYFLDGIRVPLLYHLALGPSVIHPALVERVDLYPGGYPARFGGFAGGIVSGETTAPVHELHGEASLRLVDAGAMVETPLADGKAVLLVGGRYSYTGALLSLLAPNVTLGYWDYQARLSVDMSARDRVEVFAFGAYDYLGDSSDGVRRTLFATQFHRMEARYDRLLDGGGRSRVAVAVGEDLTRGERGQSVRDRLVTVRQELWHPVAPGVVLRAGTQASLDAYDVVLRNIGDGGTDETPRAAFPTRSDVALGAHLDAQWTPSRGVTVVPGLRTDFYGSQGATAVGVDPRISARFRVSDAVTLLHAHGLAHQPPSFVIPLPGFQIGGLRGGLQTSVQSSSGVEVRLPLDVSATVTAFDNVFLSMTDTLSLPRGSTGSDNRLETRSLGNAYGLEVFLRRRLTRSWGGFLSYTLSRSTRSIGGAHVVAAFDRPHVLSLALTYDLGRRWRLGSRLAAMSGLPRDEGVYDPTGARREHRLPPFYRVDVRLEKRWPVGEAGSVAFVIEGMNVTLQKEQVSVDCTPRGCVPVEIGPVALPSVGVEAVF